MSSLVLRHLPVTALEAACGFLVGNLGAVALAITMTQLRTIRGLVLSSAIFLRSIPIVALTPILTLWLGLGLAPKVLIVALLSFFPTLVVTARGLSSVDPLIIDIAKSFNASQTQILTKIRIPASAPYIFSGLKVAAPIAVVGALVAEWIGANRGVGHLMAIASLEFRTDLLWVTSIASIALGVTAYALIALFEHWMVPWSRRI